MNRRSIIKLFLISTVSALLVRLFVVEDYRIVSNSMFPNLETGKLILVSKSSFSLKLPFSSYEIIKFARPKRAEIVAFSLPEKSNVTYVKRIVAVAGDRVEIKEGNLYVNGALAQTKPESSSLREIASSDKNIQTEQIAESAPYTISIEPEKLPNYGPVDVPPNHFFALGDNRTESVDSRSWGPVPYSCLKGRVLASF